MKALLVGGPKNGTVLYIKAGITVLTDHDGKRYEYHQKMFACLCDGIDSVWPVWVHGNMPTPAEVLSMIQKAEIYSVDKASEVPPELLT